MNNFNTQIEGNKYKLQFETSNRNNYRAIQHLARMCVNGKELTLVNYYPPDDTQNVELTLIRHGYWKNSNCYFTCSFCGTDIDKFNSHECSQHFAYCPACGTKMRV